MDWTLHIAYCVYMWVCYTTRRHQKNVWTLRLTQCPSSVANTSFPSLIFPETWLTLSLLPRNGWRTERRERRSGEREGRWKMEAEGEEGPEERNWKGRTKGRERKEQEKEKGNRAELNLMVQTGALHSIVLILLYRSTCSKNRPLHGESNIKSNNERHR